MARKREDLTGKKFHRLVVKEPAEDYVKYNKKYDTTYKYPMWICECDCGNTTGPVLGQALKKGSTKSCGCLQRERSSEWANTVLKFSAKKHGLSYHPLYDTWCTMRHRCNVPTSKSYENYGGRGISVCSRWDTDKGGSFENFLEDMGEKPAGLTLERLDVNGDYCPENCCWATHHQQGRNRRTNLESPNIYFRSGKYDCFFSHNKQVHRVGRFDTLYLAQEALEDKLRELGLLHD